MNKLTQNEKRIKIAEACGWKYISHLGPVGYAPWRKQYAPRDLPEELTLDPLPDYFNDLNACHEAWVQLPPIQHEQFKWHLVRVCRESPATRGPKKSATCATAAQRAEAFGRTLNLWEADQ